MFINLHGLPSLFCLLQAHFSLGNKYLSVCMDILTKCRTPPHLFDICLGGSHNRPKCMANSTLSNYDYNQLCIPKLESLTVLTKLPWFLYYCMIIHNNDDDDAVGGGGDKNHQIRHSYLLIVPQQKKNHATMSLHVSSMHYQSSGLSDKSRIITLQIYWTILSESFLFQLSKYHYTDIFLLFTSMAEQLR